MKAERTDVRTVLGHEIAHHGDGTRLQSAKMALGAVLLAWSDDCEGACTCEACGDLRELVALFKEEAPKTGLGILTRGMKAAVLPADVVAGVVGALTKTEDREGP